MTALDPILLARIQFAFTVSFHIIFPALTIGLASFLAILEYLWLRTNNKVYHDLYMLWVKVFAVAFGMGVVSGVVMAYQFGTNWATLIAKIGNIIGPLLGYEVMTAFFLEASFLGIMLFGWGRVSNRMHFFSTCAVAIGTIISAFWILSANSWMQTPQGFTILDDGSFYPTNWLEIIFNPSFPIRMIHMITAAFLTTSFVLGGVSAMYIKQKRHLEQSRTMLKLALFCAAILAPAQLLIGDLHGLNTLQHQPSKVAAMEGLWESQNGAPLLLFAMPDQKTQNNKMEVGIPKLSSLILTHSFEGNVKGLKEWRPDERPPVSIVFWSFRVMVGIGLLMITLSAISIVRLFSRTLFQSNILMTAWIAMIPSGFVALLAGWFVTEVGRQPYVVYGYLKTAAATSPGIAGEAVAWSLLSFVIMYSFVFGAGIYYMCKLISAGISQTADHQHLYGSEALIIEATKEKHHV